MVQGAPRTSMESEFSEHYEKVGEQEYEFVKVPIYREKDIPTFLGAKPTNSVMDQIYDSIKEWELRKHQVVVAALHGGVPHEEVQEVLHRLGYEERINSLKEDWEQHYERQKKFHGDIAEKI